MLLCRLLDSCHLFGIDKLQISETVLAKTIYCACSKAMISMDWFCCVALWGNYCIFHHRNKMEEDLLDEPFKIFGLDAIC